MSPQESPSRIKIRRLEASDIPILGAMIENAWSSGELSGHARHEVDRWIESLPDDPAQTYVAVIDGVVAGFLGVTWDSLIVAPEWRRRGIGTALVRTALVSHPELELAPPTGSATAEPFLTSVGFKMDHLLRQMRLRPEAESRPPVWPAGFVLQLYDDIHFDRYFDLLNQAFSDHPTPLQVLEARMRAVHSRPDFDPSLIALIGTSDDPANLVAFTFLRTPRSDDRTLTGSIGMIGVDRAYRRRGLGRQLLRWGIERLKRAGCDEITLEVVDVNERALPLYESEGFSPTQSWPFWRFHSPN